MLFKMKLNLIEIGSSHTQTHFVSATKINRTWPLQYGRYRKLTSTSILEKLEIMEDDKTYNSSLVLYFQMIEIHQKVCWTFVLLLNYFINDK